MDTTMIDQAAAYVNKSIVAVTPIAQKAYSIGLLTVQIDAAQTLVACFVGLFITSCFWFVMSKHKNKCIKIKGPGRASYYRSEPDWCSASSFDEFGFFMTRMLSLVPGIIALITLCNVWLWIKLFQPELWLAKQAIEAVVDHVAK